MPHISFKIKAESISTFGTNGLRLCGAASTIFNTSTLHHCRNAFCDFMV